MNDELNIPNEGMSTLGAQFTGAAVKQITKSLRMLMERGWNESKIKDKMKDELANYDEHTRNRLYDMANGKNIQDDIPEGDVISETEVKANTIEIKVKKVNPALQRTGLARYRGRDWYIAVADQGRYVFKEMT